MSAQVEPPPKRGTGRLAKGCLILIVLGILLVVVGVGGTYWSLRHVFLSDKPAPIPEATAPSETSGAATLGETSVATPSEKSAEVRERLDTMKQAARAHERTGVELTAGDINALIAWHGVCWHRRRCRAGAVLHSAAKTRRSISKCTWSGRSVFERDCHHCSAAGDQREQRAAERGDAQRQQNFPRPAGLASTGSRKIAANLRDQICQPVRSNGWRNQGRQSNFAHQRPLIALATGVCLGRTSTLSHPPRR